MMLNSVVLPDPFGPIRPVMRALRHLSVQSSSAWTPPNALRIPSVRSSAVMSGAVRPAAALVTGALLTGALVTGALVTGARCRRPGAGALGAAAPVRPRPRQASAGRPRPRRHGSAPSAGAPSAGAPPGVVAVVAAERPCWRARQPVIRSARVGRMPRGRKRITIRKSAPSRISLR